MNRRVAVIGGGISGLSTAYRLKRAGVDVVLFEAGASVGGSIRTEVQDGFLIESGPNSTLSSALLLELIDDLGLAGEIAEPNANAKKRYILKDGKLVAMPSRLLELLTSKVFSSRAKLRLLKEPFVRSTSADDESVADFFERRFGAEMVEYAVDPFVSGIYAGDPHRLSIREAFPRLYEMEREHGSLVWAQIFGGRDKTQPRPPKGAPRSLTFKRGMQTLTDALYTDLKDRVRLNTRVDAIARHASGGYVIGTAGDDGRFEGVVISTPARAAGSLIDAIDGDLASELRDIRYAPVSVVFTAFRSQQVAADVNGFGFLVPGSEKRRILGSLWTSSVFDGRAPDDHHLFTTFVGGSREPALCDNADDEVVKIVVDELGSILGITGDPVFSHVKKWSEAIPQYNIGYGAVPTAIRKFSKSDPGIYFCTNFYKGISVGDCIKNSVSVASEAVQYISALD